MQTKSSYRVLKWTLLAGMVASMATACVVSSGDGDGDDIDVGAGGDGGNTPTAGTKTTGGGGNSTGGTSAGTGTNGGDTTDGGEPPTTNGGTPATFTPGECQVDAPLDSMGTLALCDEAASDDACMACVKDKVCPQVMACFGTSPATACSVGQTQGADGQFVCVTKCFAANTEQILDADELLASCAATCDECGSGGLNDETGALIDEANKVGTCQAECFPLE